MYRVERVLRSRTTRGGVKEYFVKWSLLSFTNTTMGACLPKSPTCGEVNPSTKLFNVCCGGRVIIENSEIDGVNGHKKEHYLKEKTKQKDQCSSTLTVL